MPFIDPDVMNYYSGNLIISSLIGGHAGGHAVPQSPLASVGGHAVPQSPLASVGGHAVPQSPLASVGGHAVPQSPLASDDSDYRGHSVLKKITNVKILDNDSDSNDITIIYENGRKMKPIQQGLFTFNVNIGEVHKPYLLCEDENSNIVVENNTIFHNIITINNIQYIMSGYYKPVKGLWYSCKQNTENTKYSTCFLSSSIKTRVESGCGGTYSDKPQNGTCNYYSLIPDVLYIIDPRIH